MKIKLLLILLVLLGFSGRGIAHDEFDDINQEIQNTIMQQDIDDIKQKLQEKEEKERDLENEKSWNTFEKNLFGVD